MITFGVDAHKRSHTIVAVDDLGRKIATHTIKTTTSEHLDALAWAKEHTPDGHARRWAIEDCRHMTRRLEADLLTAGEDIVRVPPKLMAHVRDSARTYGKSDPIDALAVARAALREPDLPVARLDGVERDIRLLVDHREALIRERTALVNRLRWYLHELDPGTEITTRGFRRLKAYTLADLQLADKTGTVALTAAKILGETAGIDRFTSSDAFASYNGTAPLPVWSANVPRHRLSRTGNRQLNAAIHRIALTQARHHQPAKDLVKRRVEGGKSGREALRVLKRHISRTVYQALRTDQRAQLDLAA